MAALALAAGTFLAGIVVNKDLTVNGATWIGFAFLAAVIVLCLNQLRPHTFSFSLNVEAFDERANTDDIDTLLRAASRGLREDAASNQTVLNHLFRQYLASVSLFVVGTATTVISLVGS